MPTAPSLPRAREDNGGAVAVLCGQRAEKGIDLQAGARRLVQFFEVQVSRPHHQAFAGGDDIDMVGPHRRARLHLRHGHIGIAAQQLREHTFVFGRQVDDHHKRHARIGGQGAKEHAQRRQPARRRADPDHRQPIRPVQFVRSHIISPLIGGVRPGICGSHRRCSKPGVLQKTGRCRAAAAWGDFRHRSRATLRTSYVVRGNCAMVRAGRLAHGPASSDRRRPRTAGVLACLFCGHLCPCRPLMVSRVTGSRTWGRIHGCMGRPPTCRGRHVGGARLF